MCLDQVTSNVPCNPKIYNPFGEFPLGSFGLPECRFHVETGHVSSPATG